VQGGRHCHLSRAVVIVVMCWTLAGRRVCVVRDTASARHPGTASV
jgi:hypothetical protein